MDDPRMKEGSGGYACLINNLGGVPPLEMTCIAADLMKCKFASDIKLLIGPAPMCTSLDMNGISLSFLCLSPMLKEMLLKPTTSRAWPAAVVPEFPKPAAGITVDEWDAKVSPSSDET